MLNLHIHLNIIYIKSLVYFRYTKKFKITFSFFLYILLLLFSFFRFLTNHKTKFSSPKLSHQPKNIYKLTPTFVSSI